MFRSIGAPVYSGSKWDSLKLGLNGGLISFFKYLSQFISAHQGWFFISEMPFLQPNLFSGSFINNPASKCLSVGERQFGIVTFSNKIL